MSNKRNQHQQQLTEEDIKIEKGELDPTEEDTFYPKGVLTILNLYFKRTKIQRPLGKKSPMTSIEEIKAITEFIHFRPPNIVLKVYSRIPTERKMSFKRQQFVRYFFGEAKYNGAKAARMAGYSPRCAKQIAYRIKQS